MSRKTIAFVLFALALAGPLAAERVALVIGNDEYEHIASLKNAVGDAEALTETLKELRFEVTLRKNLEEQEIKRAVRNFAEGLGGGDLAWFYFAGHGVQVRGKNYLLPVDFEPTSPQAVEDHALSADSVRKQFEENASLRVLVLDACRNTPVFPTKGRNIQPVAPGLAEMTAATGTLIAYSTGMGNVADDSNYGESGLYMSRLLPELKKERVELHESFRNAKQAVMRDSKEKQNPALYDELFGDVYLRGGGEDTAPPPSSAGGDPCGDPAAAQREEREWKAIEGTESERVLEAYIGRYGSDPCAAVWTALAEARLEELRKGAAEPALTAKAGERFRDCDACPEMVVLPAGSFLMGSPASEEGRYSNEGPQHRVEIREAFAAGVYEVTREEYGTFVAETGHAGGSGCYVWTGSDWKEREGADWRSPGYSQTGRDPAVCVSWGDARAYVEWLKEKTGEEYRLLSEAEWEYAARAGTRTRYSFGEEITPSDANYDKNIGKTQPVGSYAANGFGLHDMHGNVYEWVQDCWNYGYAGAPNNGDAWETGDCSFRVLRGGSWSSISWYLRSANRIRFRSGLRSSSYGFRVARTLTP